MPKGFDIDQRDALLHVYGHFITVDGNIYVSAKEIKGRQKLLLSTSYLGMLLETLQSEGFLEPHPEDDDDQLQYTITRAGVLEAEKVILGRGQSLDEFETEYRRAANTGKIVGTDHPYLREADTTLAELEVHLREDNDIGALTSDDREVAKSEVGELRESIKKAKVRTHALWIKAHDVLLWIIEKGAGSMVGEIAKRALKPIQDFINVFFN